MVASGTGSARPTLTLGIEEEYFLVDPATRDLVRAERPGFMRACKEALGGQVSPELLQAQVEVQTKVCGDVAEAREQLARLRGTVIRIAREHGLAVIAASTHPFATWPEQRRTRRARYKSITDEFQALARRQLISGMHVHAGIEDRDLRVDLMNQVSYFLPYFLALSASSPFWEGHDTGLAAFRRTVATDLPRAGSPERFSSWADWQDFLGTLASVGLVDDPSRIWWHVRPSAENPTLELRIPDICTTLGDAVTIAALYQCVLRHLAGLRERNQSWRLYRVLLIEENVWRAQRWGTRAELADLAQGRLRPYAELLAELVQLVADDAKALGCSKELRAGLRIVERGTSAERQLAVHAKALDGGAEPKEALRAVVDWLIHETAKGTG